MLETLLLLSGRRLRRECEIERALDAIDDRRMKLHIGDTAESRLKVAANACIDSGVIPTPRVLNFILHCTEFGEPGKNLNGREANWRREVLLARGFVRGKNYWRRSHGVA